MVASSLARSPGTAWRVQPGKNRLPSFVRNPESLVGAARSCDDAPDGAQWCYPGVRLQIKARKCGGVSQLSVIESS